MKFTAVIAAALLGAAPVLAGQRGWCPGGDARAVEAGCRDNRVPLAANAQGTCCVNSQEEYRKMVNVCFALGKTPQYDGVC